MDIKLEKSALEGWSYKGEVGDLSVAFSISPRVREEEEATDIKKRGKELSGGHVTYEKSEVNSHSVPGGQVGNE